MSKGRKSVASEEESCSATTNDDERTNQFKSAVCSDVESDDISTTRNDGEWCSTTTSDDKSIIKVLWLVNDDKSNSKNTDIGKVVQQFSALDEIRNIHGLRGFINAVNENGTNDITYYNDAWNRNVGPELLRAATRSRSTRHKQNSTWTMVHVVNNPWNNTSKLNENNIIQGNHKRPNSSVYNS